MNVISKNGPLLILVITAFACSRMIFALFNDPEGPNLFVVTGMAAFLYIISAAAYISHIYPSLAAFKRCSVAILIQVSIAACAYFALR